MSLPTKWVDALFTKLTLAYGRDFLGRWEGVDVMDVKTDWGHELAGFERCPEAIAYALAHLPVKPPTVMEFRDICRKAPQPEVPRLECAPAAPERVAAALATMAPIHRGAFAGSKDWAWSLQARHEAGEVLGCAQIRCYREALRLDQKAVAA